ncbi:MAG: DUF58 domain-containing protein [Candidatus Omnitrophota bacterium]
MLSSDFIKKIRRIQITTAHLVTDVFAGQYHSVFKGRGIEFEEVRTYIPGDEIRSIDWNVTARTGHPHVKKFTEERELTVLILLDVSSSCGFGSSGQLKSQLAAEICSLLAFSAIKNNDKVGFLAFSDRVEKFLPPRKGTRHVLRVVREALVQSAQENSSSHKSTNLADALTYLLRVVKRSAVVFIISDFYSLKSQDPLPQDTFPEFDFKRPLSVAGKKHDVIAMTLTDPRELQLPEVGIIRMEDAETGNSFFVDTTDASVREGFRRRALAWQNNRKRLFRSLGIDFIDIRADQPYWKALIRFFQERERRMRSR